MAVILLSGFGGQGILFAGKQLTKAGMEAGKNVSWLPSYGPEMRGGTCNCSVNIDDKPIGSPLVTAPDILIVMNLPSLDKFERKVVPGGCVFVDSSLVPKTCERTDIRAYYIPATKLADEAGLKGLANVIMLGKVIRETGIFDYEFFRSELLASAPKSKPQLGELNAQALKIGYDG